MLEFGVISIVSALSDDRPKKKYVRISVVSPDKDQVKGKKREKVNSVSDTFGGLEVLLLIFLL